VNKKLNIHYLQHVHFEKLGVIEDWCYEYGHQLNATKFYENFVLPKLSEFDILIVLGGPMNIDNTNEFPWLKQEKEFISKAIVANKIVIGICLGAQLIAQILGSKIIKNPDTEIGFFNIELTAEGKNSNILSEFERRNTVFHWHGDTFDIPKDAINLASSHACKNQAFLYKNNVLGLQFHLEMMPGNIKEIIEYNRDELTDSEYIQSENEIISKLNLTKSTNRLMYSILNKLTEQ